LREGVNIFLYDQPFLVIVMLAVNALTALNLTRLYRLVFLGSPQQKTRRAPEVPWTMAVPMVSLAIVTLLAPVILKRLHILPDLLYLNWTAVILIVGSGTLGVLLGATVSLNRTWARPVQIPLKFVQDLLAYDFYVDRLYDVTVVWFVSYVSRLNAWIDRYVVDGFVNLVGLASIFSGESLKYSVSGQSQFYLFTILLGVSLLGFGLTFLW
jgi:NAD(P)H-quinone oxidoreductase subunit 5